MCPITGMKHHSAWGESSPAGRLVAGSNGWWISRKQDDASGCRGSDCASSKGRCIALVTTMSGARQPQNGYGCATSRSEEHTSELQSLMRISYAVFCLKKKKHR